MARILVADREDEIDRSLYLRKRIWTIFICALLMLCALVPSGFVSAADEQEEITVGVPTDRCPIFYLDLETNEIVGIGVDLMRAAAEKAGYQVVFRVLEEETLKDALDNSSYDLIMPFGSAITSTVGHNSVVSENLLQTPFTLVTSGSHELPPLNALKVGMLKSLSGAADTVHAMYPGIEIVMYETMEECVKALRADKVNALLHNSYVWDYVMQKPSYSDLKVQPLAMFSMDFRAGARDTVKARRIIERLNTGIASMPDTLRQAVILDYTSRRLYRYGIGDYIYQYGSYILLITLLFVALLIIAVQRIHRIRKKNEAEIRHMVERDRLTGTYSMAGFRKRVEEVLHDYPDNRYIMVFANVRNFKYINDSLGRRAGDDLLRYWADVTMKALSDREVVGRVGADHLAVLRQVEGEEKIAEDDNQIIDSVRTYFVDRGKEYRVQICGGIYMLMPEDYRDKDVDRMLDKASVAERKMRAGAGDGYEFYNRTQWDQGKHAAEVINHLPKALEDGELQVWYQPQVDYDTGEITGAEALCRWDHDKLGWLQPIDFISTLEATGLIYSLDCYVWDKACQDLHRWNTWGLHRHVSVNVSRADIREDRELPAYFRDLVRKYDVSPDQLGIEITETAYAENSEFLIRTTERLREYGFQVEMDDFGSGYSSLHMLKEVPVDRIKLDLRFLTKDGDQERGRIIVGYMIRMINSLGMRIITEGVETAEQAEFLRSQGSTEMQGYYFHKPMPVQDFEDLQS